ncbi:hypothetical protein PR048_006034, partial [Dryococelus australis]
MEAVLAAVRESGETILNASKSYNDPYGTSCRHLKKGTTAKSSGRETSNITLRTPEPTSVARARGCNKPQVNRGAQKRCNNTVERGRDRNRYHNQQTSLDWQKKQVGVISSSERGSLTTIIGWCNAAGQFLPPYFIFARKKMFKRDCLMELQYFVHQVRPSPEKKVLLLRDNHISHKYYPAVEFARMNNVVFLSFPPHATNKLQPLDRAAYGPFKTLFKQEINIFQKAHPGRIMNLLDVARLVTPAFLKCALAKNAVHGFSSTRLWPFNRNIFGEEYFAPATVTDHPPPLDKPVPNQDRVASPPDNQSSFLKTRRHDPRKQVHFSCSHSSSMRLGTKTAKENVTGQRYLQAPHK